MNYNGPIRLKAKVVHLVANTQGMQGKGLSEKDNLFIVVLKTALWYCNNESFSL